MVIYQYASSLLPLHDYVFSFLNGGGRHLSPLSAMDGTPTRGTVIRDEISENLADPLELYFMSFSQKQPTPRPPEKGSFPLDHDGECSLSMRMYLDCMKKAKNDNSKCREESKNYLECRMDRYSQTSFCAVADDKGTDAEGFVEEFGVRTGQSETGTAGTKTKMSIQPNDSMPRIKKRNRRISLKFTKLTMKRLQL